MVDDKQSAPALPRVVRFPFYGYGPEHSAGLAVPTGDGRIVLAESETNLGTAVESAFESAASGAARALGADRQETSMLFFTPDDPVAPGSVWQAAFTSRDIEWAQVDVASDADLQAAVSALTAAFGR